MDIKVAKIPGGKFIGETRRFTSLIPAAITIILHLDRAELEKIIRTVILRLGKTPTTVDYNCKPYQIFPGRSLDSRDL